LRTPTPSSSRRLACHLRLRNPGRFCMHFVARAPCNPAFRSSNERGLAPTHDNGPGRDILDISWTPVEAGTIQRQIYTFTGREQVLSGPPLHTSQGECAGRQPARHNILPTLPGPCRHGLGVSLLTFRILILGLRGWAAKIVVLLEEVYVHSKLSHGQRERRA